MRGAPVANGIADDNHRIIPADAGSTSPVWLQTAPRPDHPRGCGEHLEARHARRITEGSSPRMRGALTVRAPLHLTSRIIPADAGSTTAHEVKTCRKQDHPRGCGEHAPGPYTWCPRTGSSPRMRGAPTPLFLLVSLMRIIPADAGSTDPKIPCQSTE